MQGDHQEQSNTNGHSGNGAQEQQVWERELLTRLAMSSLNEQRRARRWRIFFTCLGFIYFAFLLVLLAQPRWEESATKGSHSAVINVNGIITSEADANAERVIAGLKAAFKNENTVGVILRINSPGGSPVQAGYIYNEMVRLRNENPNIPLYSVIEDVGASGGYYLAAGAEKIYADKASIVGSIGVRMDSFGFVEAMEKLGVERRLLTAGSNKALLDPFLPEDEESKKHLQSLLDDVHGQFIEAVKSQRGDRLVESDDMFSGLIWTGEKSVALGLVDELGDVNYVAREVIGEENLRDFTHREDIISRFAKGLGTTFFKLFSESIRPALH